MGWGRRGSAPGLGNSYISKMPVIDLVGYAFPATMRLSLASLFLALVISLPLGVLAP